MKTFLFLLVLILATTLRLYQLGSVPISLDWDEVSIGYNAFSIMLTGADEFGNDWPVSIRSFNDYKPPLLTYLTIPSIAMLGLNEFAVRLPSAILGVVGVWALYALVKEIFISHPRRDQLALLAAALLSISPWHIQFSRAAFEANSALASYLLFLWAFARWQNYAQAKGARPIPSYFWILLSASLAAVTLYAYHSVRVIVPLMVFFLAFNYRDNLWKHRGQVGAALILGTMLLIPLLVVTFRGSSAERFNSVSIFTNPGEFSRERELMERMKEFKADSSWPFTYFYSQKVTYARIVARNYFEHFNFDFLFLRGDGNLRHHTTGMGLLYLAELPFLLMGLLSLVGEKKVRHKSIVWAMLILGPAAASLTASTPHAIRSLLVLPSLTLFISLGLVKTWAFMIDKQKGIAYLGALAILTIFALNIFYYLNLYYVIYPADSAKDWQYGYKELVSYLQPLEDDYNHILVTRAYDQPHIYFAFYKQINPRAYQAFSETASSGFGVYQFKDIKFDEETDLENSLIVVEPDRSPNLTPLHQIYFPDGEVAFNIFETGAGE